MPRAIETKGRAVIVDRKGYEEPCRSFAVVDGKAMAP